MRIHQIATNYKANNARPNFGLRFQATPEFKDYIGSVSRDGWTHKEIVDSFEELEKDVDKNLLVIFDKHGYLNGKFTYNITVTDGKFKEKFALPSRREYFNLHKSFLSAIRDIDENFKLSNGPIKELLDKTFYKIALDDVGP